ncbi:MAG TPA: type VI secretion system contractile sheath small subunit [Pyrinomonadaceae bacterium]|jgi:type VI secretion system protein ImpB
MPKTESTQHKLSRVRAPRVHITYDVEVGNAIEAKELPFVVGVLGDFSGKPDEPLPRVKERKFIEIDRDNFDKVLAAQKPRLAYAVRNRLTPGGGNLNVELRFNSLDDFEPDRVVQKVEPMRELADKRQLLSDLLSKMDGNDKLEGLLTEIIKNSGARSELSKNLGLGDAPAGDGGGGKKEGEE